MNNNDLLRRLRFAFDYNDDKMIQIFNQVEHTVSREQICAWLKKEDVDGYLEMSDVELAIFLNGLIIERRGRKEGSLPEPEDLLTNNIIFRKLKIALDLKDDNVLEVMKLADFNMSKYELSAFFRRPEHRNYRVCKDQILRNFLQGVQVFLGKK